MNGRGRRVEEGVRARAGREREREREVCSLILGVAQTQDDAVATRCDPGITCAARSDPFTDWKGSDGDRQLLRQVLLHPGIRRAALPSVSKPGISTDDCMKWE